MRLGDLGTFSPARYEVHPVRIDAVIMPILLCAAGTALLAVGAVMVLRAQQGRRQIRRELSAQRIIFPAEGRLSPELVRYAGVQVTTGVHAMAFAQFIGANLAQATDGRTYSQISDEWHAAGRADERLARLRETAFMGETLRGSLLSAYQAWQVTILVLGLGGITVLIGLVFLALGLAWP